MSNLGINILAGAIQDEHCSSSGVTFLTRLTIGLLNLNSYSHMRANLAAWINLGYTQWSSNIQPLIIQTFHQMVKLLECLSRSPDAWRRNLPGPGDVCA